MVTEALPFWNTKTLEEMTTEEWESLCDGCGRCCLQKLEDIDTGLYFYTNVACRLLDDKTCRCKNYPERIALVKDCLVLSPTDRQHYDWLPVSCAYRRLAHGLDLEWWHPLVSGTRIPFTRQKYLFATVPLAKTGYRRNNWRSTSSAGLTSEKRLMFAC